MRRAMVAILAAAGMAALLVGTLAPTASAGRWDLPGYKKCGTFRAAYVIHVYAKHTRCKIARRVQREYWLAPRRRLVIHNGGAGAAGWVTLKRYPGWRCTSGSGGGACAKGRKQAAYQN